MSRYKLPLGVDNFHKLVTGGYLFCDKTAMLSEFLSKGDEVTLITRPRRWGKTLNMSMLHHFFAPEVNGISTASLFDDLAIGQIEGGKWVKEHQGQHPVIMVSFKDVHADNFQGAYDSIYLLLKKLYGSFEYLLKSDKLNFDERDEFYAILDRSANQQQLEQSLKLLSTCLYRHHGKRSYILIDEYDAPLNKAYGNPTYLNALVAFMRNLFSASLKGNNSLEKGVLTGILRVSKDSMLSGLNNLETYTLLDEDYSSHFGFDEEEVKDLLQNQDLSIDFEEVKSWYNGYRVGSRVMYNPWSILSCMNRSGKFDVYWVNTGNNDLIKRSILKSNSGIKCQFERLMQGASIVVPIDKHLSFDLLDRNEIAFWSLLLFAGYLKFDQCNLSTYNDLYDCTVRVPNQEVLRLYNRFFSEWFVEQFEEESQYSSFLSHLIKGDVVEFVQELSNYLFKSASMFDVQAPRKSEGFYHVFVLAMLASLGHTHYIKSNRESGRGRYDVLIISKKGTKAILLEFKYVRREEELAEKAKNAWHQIQTQGYRTELQTYPNVQEVVEVGLAFSKKYVQSAYTVYDLVNKRSGVLQLTDPYNPDEWYDG